jgi:hypothetical protein
MSKRTKVLFGLTALPVVSTGVIALWALYPHFGPQKDATYFVVYHINWRRMALASAVIFACGVISLSFDRRDTGRK